MRPRHAHAHAHMLASMLQCFPKDCAKNNFKKEMALLRIFSECKISSGPRKGIVLEDSQKANTAMTCNDQLLSTDPGWLLASSGGAVLIKEKASSFCSYLSLQ